MIAIQILFSYILFFIAVSVMFYLPGQLILSVLGKSFTKSLKQFLSWPVGYSLFIVLSYVGGWIHFVYLPLIVGTLFTMYVLLKKRNLMDFSFFKTDKFVVTVIIVGSVAFTIMSFFSGLETSKGMQYLGMVNSTDGLMHIAHIKTQVYTFPPPHAGFVGYAMHGYHYFYDFLLSRFVLFFHFSAEDLFYRLFPFGISLFYGVSFSIFATLFTKKKSAIALVVFFAYFAQSWGFILWFFTKTVDVTNGLGLVQPLELILDPSAIVSISLMLTGFYVLLEGKFTFQKALIASLILGPLAEMKVYGGIISILALAGMIVYLFLRKKSIKLYIFALFLIGILTAATYLPNNMGVGHLYLFPFFLYDIFVRQTQLFIPWNYDMRMVIYQQHHNIPRIISLYLMAFTFFWILTLGSRLFVLLDSYVVFKKEFWNKSQNVCFVLLMLIPFLMGSLLVQSFSIFSSIQFLWVVGLLIAVPAGIFYGKLYDRFGTVGRVLLVVFLVFANSGSLVGNMHLYLFQKNLVLVTPSQMKFIRNITQQVKQNEFFVVAPAYSYDKHGNKVFTYVAPFFAAHTGRVTYYEYETPEYSDTRLIDYRKKQVETITLALEKCDTKKIVAIMKQIHTPYLVTMLQNTCPIVPHMKKLYTADNWIFWNVK